MTTIQYILLYIATIPVFFAIDMIWLGFVASGFYKSQLGELLGPVNWPAAIIFYLLFIIGILVFAVIPGLEASSFYKTLMYGALFGFFTYATYDLTNLATLNNWSIAVTLVDLVWGTVLSASVASVSYWIGKTFIL